jgi:hypothetical protein
MESFKREKIRIFMGLFGVSSRWYIMILKIEGSLYQVSQKHKWLTQYIFREIIPSSGVVINALELGK